MNELQELMESNAELKEKIEALNKNSQATVADYIALAKEYGAVLTEADFQPVPAMGELSDSELEAVAGGAECFCLAGGGGKKDAWHDTCACVGGGGGTGRGGNSTCWCIASGYGPGL